MTAFRDTGLSSNDAVACVAANRARTVRMRHSAVKTTGKNAVAGRFRLRQPKSRALNQADFRRVAERQPVFVARRYQRSKLVTTSPNVTNEPTQTVILANPLTTLS
jgi:hypothetical protein